MEKLKKNIPNIWKNRSHVPVTTNQGFLSHPAKTGEVSTAEAGAKLCALFHGFTRISAKQ